MSEVKWEDRTIPEKCRAWCRTGFEEIAKMEMALNEYEKANPLNYKAINERREMIFKLMAVNQYFSWLISQYESEQEKEPIEFKTQHYEKL